MSAQADNNSSILTLKSFGAAFGERIILNDVNLSIKEKNITVLLGPGGTGKSTLLRSIAGLNDTNPSFRTWGDAVFQGAPIKQDNRPSLVTQSTRLLLKSVLENIVHNLPERNNLSQSQQKDLAVRLLEDSGLTNLKDSLLENIVNFPLAIQRRIAIIRLASTGTRLLCLDEPTTGVAEQDADGLLEHIKLESQRRAILIVLHNQAQAKRLGGYTALLAGGHINEYNETPDFFSHPKNTTTQQFVAFGSCTVAAPDADPEDLAEDIPLPPEVPQVAREYVSESFGPRGFLWLLKGQIAGTPLPGVFFDIEYDLAALQRVGINWLLSTTQSPVDPESLKPFGIQAKHFPVPDMGAPTIDQAIEICQFIEKTLTQQETIAVHCRAGLGRTGTVLALYLIWSGSDSLSALETVRNIEPRWVQSEKQIEFLDLFSQYISDNRTNSNSIRDASQKKINNAI